MGALAQNDIRRMLGYLVISGIGMMLAGLALGSATGLSGAVFYAVHSMIVMTALYFLVGMGRAHA
jgi:multicomponent Na+:H+ antiporter subunit D